MTVLKFPKRNRPPILQCSICKIHFCGFGNNPWPVNNGRCCDDCNALMVIPARIALIFSSRKPK